MLPFILGTLALLVPGDVGLGTANPRGDAADEPVQIVFLLSISAVFMGTALTIRDLVGERTDLPARTSGGPVGHGLSVGQDRGVRGDRRRCRPRS